MAKLFNMGPSPHIRTSETVEKVMYDVVIALVPAFCVAVYVFGIRAAIITAISVLTCMGTEYLCAKMMKKNPAILDGSAIITGILLAFVIPVSMPIPAVIIGSIAAIALGKMVFGGLGCNIFNPALVGRAFIQASWPVFITSFFYDGFRYNNILTGLTPDAVTGATVLEVMKSERGLSEAFIASGSPVVQAFLGKMGGCIGEVSSLALLIGGGYLIYKKQVDWKVPLIIIGTVFGMTAIMGADPIMHILSGGLFLGAFFMATDMVTSPYTEKGKIIFAVLIGFLISIIRLKGGYPEGTAYAILIANGFVPLINKYTQPKKFGEVKKNEK